MFWSRYLQTAILGALGVLASCGVYALSVSWEDRVRELEFHDQAARQLSIVNTDLQDASSLIETVRDFVESQNAPPDRQEFNRFSFRVHDRASGLRDIGWAPRVTDSERDAFEREVRASGFPEFEIKERRASGGLMRATAKPEYFPILFLDGNPASHQLIGFDLSTEAVRRQAIARALKSGRTAATPPIKLVTVAQPRGGVMSFMPVYRGQPTDHRENLSAPDGLVFGAFEIAATIENVVARPTRFADMDIYLYDPDGPPNDRLIFWKSRAAKPVPAPSEQALRASLHWESTISIIDQKWGVIFSPTYPHGGAGTWHSLVPFGAGLALTAMAVFHLVVSLRRTAQLESLTSSLRETTTGLHEKAERIAHMARHDALTGLPNRRFFFEELHRAVDQALTNKIEFAVMQIDLDGFKPINDVHGHGAGDMVLCEVAQRLRAASRGRDRVARLGGDEFAAIVESADTLDAFGSYATRILAALRQPIVVEGAVVHVGASIGIALCSRDGFDPEALMRAADLAMYCSKRQGRATYRFFEPAMDIQARERGALVTDQSRAPLDGGEPPSGPALTGSRDRMVAQPAFGGRATIPA